MTRLVIKQHRSSIGEKINARRTLAALGLRRTGQIVEQTDSPAVRGMLRRVGHLVEVTDQVGASPPPTPTDQAGASPPPTPRESK